MALLFVLIMAQPITALASSLGLDSRYRKNETSSSRDSGVYVPYQPVFLYPQTVNDTVHMTEADVVMVQAPDGGNYNLIEGLSINGQRMIESLYFRTGTVDIDDYYIKPLNTRPDIMTAERLTQYDGSYLKLTVHDFTKGIILSKIFTTDAGGSSNGLDVLEMNKGLHGYELAYVRSPGMAAYEFVLIPKTSNPGNIELMLNDTILVVIGAEAGSTVSPLKFSPGVDVSFSSLDKASAYEYDGNSGQMTQSQPTYTLQDDMWDWADWAVAGAGENITSDGFLDADTGIPSEYADRLRPGGAEKFREYIIQGATVGRAIELLEDVGFLISPDEAAAGAVTQPTRPPASDTDKFFQEAGMTNKLDELARLQGSAGTVMQNPTTTKSSSSSSSTGSSSKQSGRQLDTSRIDLDPMTWGVSIRDGSSYGTITTDGDQLLAGWSDKMEINITSLTGKAHEFVQRKAVRPKPIIPIQPTEKEVLQTSTMLSLIALASGCGIVFFYVILMNSYTLKVRKRIKMAEIESLKSSGGIIIGDLESFEIS